LKNSYFLEWDFRRIRIIAVASSVAVHVILFLGLLVYQNEVQRAAAEDQELLFGGSGGGGGEGAQGREIQFGSQGDVAGQTEPDTAMHSHRFFLINIHPYDESAIGNPVPREDIKPTAAKTKRKQKLILASDLPARWIRRGSGPGSGGGTGGGSGGGIGKGQGYSIDWGGSGSRRLLSGKLPRYPEGTDKQMTVALRFTVMPDGTVQSISPLRKTDELLESAAVTALKTWQFDPLPSGIEQRPQTGKVTFRFTLE
jgi:TonB family protein